MENRDFIDGSSTVAAYLLAQFAAFSSSTATIESTSRLWLCGTLRRRPLYESLITDHCFFYRGVGRSAGVGRGLGVGEGLGVGVGVAVGVGVGVGVGVTAGPSCTSKEPMSIRSFLRR